LKTLLIEWLNIIDLPISPEEPPKREKHPTPKHKKNNTK
jgi:hypothetical protein